MPRCSRCRVKDFGLGFGEKPPFLCPRCVEQARDTAEKLNEAPTAEGGPAVHKQVSPH